MIFCKHFKSTYKRETNTRYKSQLYFNINRIKRFYFYSKYPAMDSADNILTLWCTEFDFIPFFFNFNIYISRRTEVHRLFTILNNTQLNQQLAELFQVKENEIGLKEIKFHKFYWWDSFLMAPILKTHHFQSVLQWCLLPNWNKKYICIIAWTILIGFQEFQTNN